MNTRRNQQGLTLIEILASLAILSAVTAGVARLIDQYTEDVKTTVIAQHMESIGKAARQYIKDNYAAVQAVATPTTPALITVPILKAAGYLDAGVTTTNNFGQGVCVVVLEPTPDMLEGLVVAEGGTGIDDITLGGIAASLGAAGGGVYSTGATTLRGAMGAWSAPVGNFANANASGFKCDGSTAGAPTIAAGHPVMALWFENADTSSNFVNRNAIAGRPDLNTMNTPLIMNSVQTSGGACSPTGAISRDAGGTVLSCQGGTWKGAGATYWKDPVATFAALPNTDAVGSVRMTLDTGRAFMWTGGGWSPLAVDQNGNMTVPGTFSAAGGKVIAWNAVAEGGVLQMQGANGTNIYLENINGTFRLINHPWNVQIFSVDQAGNVAANGSIYATGAITSNGRLTSNEYVQINGGATEGWGCAPNGLVGRDGNGLLLSCQSGIWKKAGGWDASSVTTRIARQQTFWNTWAFPGGIGSATASCNANEALTACTGTATSGVIVQTYNISGKSCIVWGSQFLAGTDTMEAQATCSM